MDILEKIIAHKRREIRASKQKVPVKTLEGSPLFNRKAYSMRDQLEESRAGGIIAEFKRRSPSRGIIAAHAAPAEITQGYLQAGATGLSVLTDNHYFGGSAEDLMNIREASPCPILRKDFMIDEYQILEAKAWGADVILLIAAVLDPYMVRGLSALARSLGLEVLLEVHRESELGSVNQFVDMVGVNNRDLKKMVTDVHTSLALSEKIPADFCKISESGLSDPGSIVRLKHHGFQGFLIGEYFMQQADPGRACRELIEGIRNLEREQ